MRCQCTSECDLQIATDDEAVHVYRSGGEPRWVALAHLYPLMRTAADKHGTDKGPRKEHKDK